MQLSCPVLNCHYRAILHSQKVYMYGKQLDTNQKPSLLYTHLVQLRHRNHGVSLNEYVQCGHFTLNSEQANRSSRFDNWTDLVGKIASSIEPRYTSWETCSPSQPTRQDADGMVPLKNIPKSLYPHSNSFQHADICTMLSLELPYTPAYQAKGNCTSSTRLREYSSESQLSLQLLLHTKLALNRSKILDTQPYQWYLLPSGLLSVHLSLWLTLRISVPQSPF